MYKGTVKEKKNNEEFPLYREDNLFRALAR